MLEQGSPRNARRPCDIRQRERQLHVGLDEIDAALHITRRNLVFQSVQGVSIVARLPEEQLGDDKLLVHRQHGWVDSLRPGIVKVGDDAAYVAAEPAPERRLEIERRRKFQLPDRLIAEQRLELPDQCRRRDLERHPLAILS
jgi:hypothetical protein